VTERDKALCLLFLVGSAIVLWLGGSFAIDIVRLAEQTGTTVAPLSQYHSIGIEESPDLITIINRALFLGLIGLGFWSVYRLFMAFCKDLDEAGHWNRLISKRGHRHHH